MSASHMTAHERSEFHGFCRNATDRQLANILADERARARREAHKGDGSDFYQTCAEIAQREMNLRTSGRSAFRLRGDRSRSRTRGF